METLPLKRIFSLSKQKFFTLKCFLSLLSSIILIIIMIQTFRRNMLLHALQFKVYFSKTSSASSSTQYQNTEHCPKLEFYIQFFVTFTAIQKTGLSVNIKHLWKTFFFKYKTHIRTCFARYWFIINSVSQGQL